MSHDIPELPVAMITGASRGIGRALAEDLVARGWKVAALGRDIDLLSGLAAESPPDQVLPLVADVTDGTAMAQAVAALHAIWRTPDLVVANAGVLTAVGPTWEADPDQWWHDMEVNVRGVFTTMRDVVPAMVARGSGRVVVMGSGMGRFPSPWTSAYGASKAAAAHLVSSAAQELAGTGVSVFAISPGMVHTGMTQWSEALIAHRPDLAQMPESAYMPVSAATHLVIDLASGRFDALSGHFIHVRDDRELMLAKVRGLRH
ncbi:MAG: SDR family oxidoreductase [Candidatus Nanopelagicales bacterium]|jgi:NADP-dependent 3-hydroxy acid dehydrogenase YdfG|nr:SDR family oxidoreductase [Candidatus Nanopelagicales bacterium]